MSGKAPAMRLLDLTMGWAGPLAGQMLAEMGIEVIKVEDTRHFDWWRGSTSLAPAEMRPIERSAVFNSANRGKLGITLDLSRDKGVAILKRIAAHCDLALENFRAGVMERLGLSYGELSAIRPDLIMLSMPAFGYGGPESDYRGYGNTIEGMSGVTALCRYEDGGTPYMLSNALGDPVSGLNGTLAILAAIHERERTGKGQWIELAQVETVLQFMGPHLISHQVSGALPAPRGNRHPEHAPHGIYRCAGEDEWIALAACDEAQWRALAAALELGALGDDPRFVTIAARKRNEDALDGEINRATRGHPAEALAQSLKRAGLAAAAVNSAPAILGDPQLAARDFFVPIDRAVVGTHLYPGTPVRLTEMPLDASKPAPLLGEHNARVMSELLGMSAQEIAALEAEGIIGAAPRD